MISMKNKWEYGDCEVCYGEEAVYRKMADFIGTDKCEDWGCGTAWLKTYVTKYKGIDGSKSLYMDVIADLTEYTSNTEAIVIRQVLEHNYDWRTILQNAKQSFNNKLCIGIHTPLADAEHILSVNENDVPDISFCLQDILDFFPDCNIRQETVQTHFEYGTELLLYITK